MRRLATVFAATAAALWVAAPASAFAHANVVNPYARWHAAGLVRSLTLTLFSLVTVRRLATAHAGPTAAEPAAAPVD